MEIFLKFGRKIIFAQRNTLVFRSLSDDLKHKAYMQIEASGNGGPPNPDTEGNVLSTIGIALAGKFFP